MISVRPLRPWDFTFCWRLANDPSAWRHYATPKPPTWWGHVRWMLSWLCREDQQAWVLSQSVLKRVPTLAGTCTRDVVTPCALVRVERRNRRAVISVAVLPRFRSMGIGQKAIAHAATFAVVHGWGTPTAYIMAGNVASILAFRGAGFDIASQNDGWVMMELNGRSHPLSHLVR